MSAIVSIDTGRTRSIAELSHDVVAWAASWSTRASAGAPPSR